jgi:Uma2 family endonuclease
MATSTSIPLSEYLNTTYRPDCDYIDGEVKERTLGTRAHGFLQGIIAAIFYLNMDAWDIVVGPEIRTRVALTRVRIPDVCVMRNSDPADPVVQVAPLICIEVLSPEDTLRSQRDRVEDYLAMGVEHIWMLDPIRREAHSATRSGYDLCLSGELAVPGTPIRIVLAEVFAKLDKMLTPR